MNRHDIDPVSLATGIAFLALAGWWLLDRAIDLKAPTTGWFLAGALLLIGLLGMASALRADRRQPPGQTRP
jgi:hypothetical protein